MTKCQFDVLEYERSGLRGYATGQASVDSRKDFYRLLDSNKDLWGKDRWIDPSLASDKEFNEADAIHTGALPQQDEYIELLLSRISLLEHETDGRVSAMQTVLEEKDKFDAEMQTVLQEKDDHDSSLTQTLERVSNDRDNFREALSEKT